MEVPATTAKMFMFASMGSFSSMISSNWAVLMSVNKLTSCDNVRFFPSHQTNVSIDKYLITAILSATDWNAITIVYHKWNYLVN